MTWLIYQTVSYLRLVEASDNGAGWRLHFDELKQRQRHYRLLHLYCLTVVDLLKYRFVFDTKSVGLVVVVADVALLVKYYFDYLKSIELDCLD